MRGTLTVAGPNRFMESNPRGYAFIAYHRTYTRMHRWGWFAAMEADGIAPTRQEWIGDGLRLYDRMVLGIDSSDDEQLRALVGSILGWMQGSVRDSGKGRSSMVKAPDGGRRIENRVSLTLDVAPTGTDNETWAMRIPDPFDAFTAYDDRDELRWRIGRLAALLTDPQRRHLQILVDNPYGTLEDRARIAGVDKRSVDQAFWRIRMRAAKAEI